MESVYMFVVYLFIIFGIQVMLILIIHLITKRVNTIPIFSQPQTHKSPITKAKTTNSRCTAVVVDKMHLPHQTFNAILANSGRFRLKINLNRIGK